MADPVLPVSKGRGYRCPRGAMGGPTSRRAPRSRLGSSRPPLMGFAQEDRKGRWGAGASYAKDSMTSSVRSPKKSSVLPPFLCQFSSSPRGAMGGPAPRRAPRLARALQNRAEEAEFVVEALVGQRV